MKLLFIMILPFFVRAQAVPGNLSADTNPPKKVVIKDWAGDCLNKAAVKNEIPSQYDVVLMDCANQLSVKNVNIGFPNCERISRNLNDPTNQQIMLGNCKAWYGFDHCVGEKKDKDNVERCLGENIDYMPGPSCAQKLKKLGMSEIPSLKRMCERAQRVPVLDNSKSSNNK